MLKRLPAIIAAVMLITGPAMAQDQSNITLELNKVQKNGECRAFVIVGNKTGEQFPDIALTLGFFDKQGVLMGDLRVFTVPVEMGREIIYTYTLNEVRCKDLARVHVNAAICEKNGEGESCIDQIALSSKSDVELTK